MGWKDEEIAKAVSEAVTPLNQQIVDLEHKHKLEIETVNHEHEIALKDKEFDLKHFKDDEMKTMSDKVVTLEKQLEVAKKENEMLAKMTNLNADVIDIKDLVSQLIKKLPEINLSSLTVNTNGVSK